MKVGGAVIFQNPLNHRSDYDVYRDDLKIGDLSVPKGTYTLFVDISDPDNWTLIVNKQTGEWGLRYDGSQDLGKTNMTMSKPPALVEELKYTIDDLGGNKGKITLAWENHEASVPITVQ